MNFLKKLPDQELQMGFTWGSEGCCKTSVLLVFPQNVEFLCLIWDISLIKRQIYFRACNNLFHLTPHGGAGSSDKLKFNHTFNWEFWATKAKQKWLIGWWIIGWWICCSDALFAILEDDQKNHFVAPSRGVFLMGSEFNINSVYTFLLELWHAV